MPDSVIQTFWEDVGPGTKVRWATPRAVHYGVVINRVDQSLVLELWDQDKPKVLPDGLWYFIQGKKNPDGEEHLVILSEFPENFGALSGKLKPRHDGDAAEEFINVNKAIELVPMDPKRLRRYIRQGTVQAFKKDGQWVLRRSYWLEESSKRGWL